MQNFINKLLSFIFSLIIFISIFFIPVLYSDINSNSLDGVTMNSDLFSWPIPGYTYISSYYGKRKSPTIGASSFHSGIDIPAPQGIPLYAIEDGEITFCSWGARWRLYCCFKIN